MKVVFTVSACDVTLALIENALACDYNVISLISAHKMFKLLGKIMPDLIILDAGSLEAHCFDTLEKLKLKPKYSGIPVLILSEDKDMEANSLELGASDFILKPFTPIVLHHRVKLHISVDSLVQERTKQYKKLQNSVIYVLAHMIESRDGTTGQHIERTTRYIRVLLEMMVRNGTYINEIIEWNLDTVSSSARLHDIGKIAITDSILNKPAKLTNEEYEVIKTHALAGEKIIKQIIDRAEDNEFLHHARLFAGNHHERWDGEGYPRGLEEQAIPLHGRIMAIVDVYDALVSERPYKSAMSREKAMEVIKAESGKQFDPKIVEVFLKLHEQLNSGGVNHRQDV